MGWNTAKVKHNFPTQSKASKLMVMRPCPSNEPIPLMSWNWDCEHVLISLVYSLLLFELLKKINY